MSTISVQLRGLSGEVELNVPEGSTVADVREAAGLGENLNIRSGGQSVSDDAPVEEGQTLVSTPPAAKHG